MAGNENVLQLTQQTGSADTTSVIYAAAGSGTLDTGLPLSVLFNSPNLTGTPTVAGYLSSALAAATYLTQANAASTYLTQANAASTYLTITTAASTYATITNLALKANTASPTFTGTVVIPTVTVSAGTINNTVIGGTTPAAGAFTTIVMSNSISPSPTAGIVGVITGGNANAGAVGEYVTATGSAVTTTSTVAANIATLSLTAGDWDVTGTVVANNAGGLVTAIAVGISTVTATLPALTSGASVNATGFSAAGNPTYASPVVRISVSATTSVFLVTTITWSGGTTTGSGFVRARRVR